MWSRPLLLALIGIALCQGAAAADYPIDIQPETVLRLATSEPKTGFHGHAVTIRWFGDRAHSHEYSVAYMPPGRYRREYLSPNGGLDSMTVSAVAEPADCDCVAVEPHFGL